MPNAPANANNPSRPDTRKARPGAAGQDEGLDDGAGTALEDATRRDCVEADKSRPSLPEETADGLDDMDEEIRHQAEDQPLETPGGLR